MAERLREEGDNVPPPRGPTTDVATELLPLLRVYKDGTVERFLQLKRAPPSPEDPTTGVSSKDITISPVLLARIYLPKSTLHMNHHQMKIPIFVYFHGSSFVVGSAFDSVTHHLLNSIVSQAKCIAVSVEYGLAPENPLPIAYEDGWEALQWVVSHSIDRKTEPWLTQFGDFDKVYLGGDSAGANIVHTIAMRAGKERLLKAKIAGGIISFPYFFGSKPIGSESVKDHENCLLYKCWLFAYPSAIGGIDNPMMNPWTGNAPSLKGIGCPRLLVVVGEKDDLRHRGVRYYAKVKESEWEGEVEIVEVEGEGHCFHIFKPDTEKAKDLIKRFASFII